MRLLKDKEDLISQVKVLQEKRELGLHEITKLSQQLELARSGSMESDPTSPVKKNLEQEKNVTHFYQAIASPIILTQNNGSGNADDLRKLRKLKKGLDEVYMDIIMTITNEKLNEKMNETKASGKLGELIKGSLPSENFMKIEKRMNDSIVILQEYMEKFE